METLFACRCAVSASLCRERWERLLARHSEVRSLGVSAPEAVGIAVGLAALQLASSAGLRTDCRDLTRAPPLRLPAPGRPLHRSCPGFLVRDACDPAVVRLSGRAGECRGAKGRRADERDARGVRSRSACTAAL